MTEAYRILFPRPADAANNNAQAKNAQNMLRHWRSSSCRPAVLAFGPPDPVVAANPAVDVIKIRPGHLWRASVYFAYFRRFAAVFCPGVHHYADWLALKTRSLIGWDLPVIATVEGLLGSLSNDSREREYSNAAGHRVYCQKIPEPQLRRGEDLLSMARHIIAISPFLGRMAKARYGDKVSVLPLGVDISLFRRPPFNAGRPRVRVVGAGRVEPHKRPELFLRMAVAFADADFVWYGEGALREPLTAEATQLGLGNVSFPGALPPQDLAHELVSSEIFVLPSLSEGVPKVTQEAAAAGLAQIVFGFYEVPTVVDGVNGCVVWSDEELLDSLSQLLRDRGKVSAMGRAGQAMAADWSWETVALRWEERITNLLEGDLDV